MFPIKHTWGESCHSSQQISSFHKLSNSCCSHSHRTMKSWFFTSNVQFFRPLLLLKLFMSCACLGCLIQSRKNVIRKCGPLTIKNVLWFPWIPSGAELSASIAKRLISIKVLVQEEVLEPYRSVGSCATEGQLKCVIAHQNPVCFTN